MAFKINHLHLKTPDPRKTADWDVKYVGAKIVSERKTPNGRTTFRLNLHGVELNVTEFLEERVLPDGRKVCFFEGPEGVRLEFLEMR